MHEVTNIVPYVIVALVIAYVIYRWPRRGGKRHGRGGN